MPVEVVVEVPARKRPGTRFSDLELGERLRAADGSHRLRRNEERMWCGVCGATSSLVGRASLRGLAVSCRPREASVVRAAISALEAKAYQEVAGPV